jgi:2-polyprenyl-3-methyl-5-hydroxy-6-metoxy-1,4-benzoquinol methylase
LCQTNNEPLLRRRDRLPVAFCNNCYLWYVSSLPPTEEIHQLYQGYWNSFRPKDLSDYYATKVMPATASYRHDVRLNRLAALAGGIEGKRLLEIGCGRGELLGPHPAGRDRGIAADVPGNSAADRPAAGATSASVTGKWIEYDR